jgi:hypothetical protein
MKVKKVKIIIFFSPIHDFSILKTEKKSEETKKVWKTQKIQLEHDFYI